MHVFTVSMPISVSKATVIRISLFVLLSKVHSINHVMFLCFSTIGVYSSHEITRAGGHLLLGYPCMAIRLAFHSPGHNHFWRPDPGEKPYRIFKDLEKTRIFQGSLKDLAQILEDP